MVVKQEQRIFYVVSTMFRLLFINKRIIFWPLILTGTTSLASTTNFINRQDHQNLRIVSSKSVKVSQNQYIMRWVKSTQIQYVPIGTNFLASVNCLRVGFFSRRARWFPPRGLSCGRVLSHRSR